MPRRIEIDDLEGIDVDDGGRLELSRVRDTPIIEMNMTVQLIRRFKKVQEGSHHLETTMRGIFPVVDIPGR